LSIWSRIVDGWHDLSWHGLFGMEAPSHIGTDADGRPAATRQVGFTIAVIALSAKMAMADGTVSRAEVDAFHEVFPTPPEERAHVDFFFDMAKRSTAGADAYARQVARLLEGHGCVLEDLLGALFHIAKADGTFAQSEDTFLRHIAEIFHFDEEAYRRIRAYHVGTERAGHVEDDPHLILGVPHDADQKMIRSRWLSLVRENHPDRVAALGLPAEFISIANAKLARINAAYQHLVAAESPAAS
jgi:DnaJ like chaperone protein